MPSFRKKGYLSLWVGIIQPEKGIDVLSDRCGVRSYDIDSQEAISSGRSGKLLPVQKLVEKLSYSSTFLAEAIKRTEEMGVKRARYVLCQYDFAYDPDKVQVAIMSDPMFLGVFRWSSGDDELKSLYG
jgi:hypothetical protein